ncbi:IPT/TIG domain-containing protein [Fodinibius halophilus]|uniref:IPT/TIG domain-containing protein n=1 Tax=Fodinibius halophilus TaxID=1736908 RepID=A0A6M1T193_9BACT|nr:IPT/TIG domain-containing protein [Fodinibius halophilus]NGP87747.1 hypothetical protein [Fodinibius halophilus]
MKLSFTKVASALVLALTVIVTGCNDDGPNGPDSNPLSVESINPTAGQPGDEVTITGTGFANNADDNSVTFAGDVTASISSVSATELVVTVPQGATTGPITVSVDGESATTSEFAISSEPQPEIPEPYASFPGTKIAADETWSNDTTLVGPHFVLPGVTLTVEAGVEVTFEYHNGNDDKVGAIYTLASDDQNFSEPRETAKLVAEGTADQPIVFTSDRKQINSWGGIIMTGRASNNIPGGQGTVEGIEQDIFYGADADGNFNDSDDSGSLEYVRIEYAGYSINAGSELQSLTLYSIGSETNINHVNLFGSSDDGIELFGGTVDIKYLVVYGADDDSFDYDQGWSGKGQFWLAVQRDGADQGFENDGCADEADCDQGSGPGSPNISNATVIAPKNTASGKDNMGLKLREGLQGAYRNIIVSNFVGNPFYLDGENNANDDTYENYDSGDLVLENFVLQNNGPWASSDESRYSAVYEYTSSDKPADLFNNPSNYDYSLPSGSAYLSGGQAPSDSWFDDVSFRGAVGESGTQWDWVNEGIWVKWPI